MASEGRTQVTATLPRLNPRPAATLNQRGPSGLSVPPQPHGGGGLGASRGGNSKRGGGKAWGSAAAPCKVWGVRSQPRAERGAGTWPGCPCAHPRPFWGWGAQVILQLRPAARERFGAGTCSRGVLAALRFDGKHTKQLQDLGIMANPWESWQIQHGLCWKPSQRAAHQGPREIPPKKKNQPPQKGWMLKGS